MERHWLRREGGEKLVVFVLGWAADHRVVEHIRPVGCDVLTVYDYRSIEPLGDELTRSYTESYLFAWSFGVRVAEHIFGGEKFRRAVALNGTPRPVDDRFGIAPRRLEATIRGLAAGGMEAFERRAYGDSYDVLRDRLSPRGLNANVLELKELRDLSTANCEPRIAWDKAIVGTGDLIFTPENQLNYWAERAELLPLPHYPFADGRLIEREIDDR